MLDSADTIRVLLVDDEPDYAETAKEFLEQEDTRFSVDTAKTTAKGLELVDRDEFDCVVSDYDLPREDGLAFLEAVRERDSTLPFIILTGKGGEDIASQAIASGVTEYLQKKAGAEQFSILANRIEQAVEHHRTENQLQAAEQRYRALFTEMNEGMALHELVREENGTPVDYRLIDVNQRFESITGFDADQVTGRLATEVYEPSDPPYLDRFSRVVDDGESIEFQTYYEPLDRYFHISAFSLESNRFATVFHDITDRKETEERYRTYIERSPYGVFVLDSNETIRDVNDAACVLMGYNRDEVLGASLQSVIDPGSAEGRATAFESLQETGEMREEFRYRRGDGSRGFLDIYAVEIPRERYLAFADDITDRKDRMRQLQRYQRMVDSMVGAACIYDLSGRFEVVNEYLADWYGTTKTELKGKPSNLLQQIRAQHDEDPFQALIDGEIDELQGEVEGEFPGHGYAVLEYGLTPLEVDGEIDGIVGVTRDLTEHYTQLREIERQNTIIHALHDVTAKIDSSASRQRIFELLVDAAEDILDYDIALVDAVRDNELVPQAISSNLDDEQYYDATPVESERSLAATAYRQQDSSVVEDLRDHDVAPADPAYRSALTVSIGEFGVFQAVDTRTEAFDSRDRDMVETLVTHAKSRLEQMQRMEELESRRQELANQNERLEQFASIVSHDLRNPLNVAQGRAKMAADECPSDHIDEVIEAHERMEDLIDQLLNLARLGEQIGSIETVDLGAMAENCWANVDTHDARFVNDVDKTIFADRSGLKQLLENLFGNAVKHNEETVTVTVGDLETGFFVEDDGNGIPRDDRQKIFEPGYSTATGGTGLGLNIVKQISDAHGWTVEYAVGISGGARFEFTDIEEPVTHDSENQSVE